MDNDYLSSTPTKTFVKVDIILLVYILLPVQIDLVLFHCQKYSIKYIYSTSQISKLSLTLHTFSITGSVAGLFLTSMSNYSITDYIAPYDLHGIPDLISENFSIPKVVTYLL